MDLGISAVRLDLEVQRLLPNGVTIREECGSTHHTVSER